MNHNPEGPVLPHTDLQNFSDGPLYTRDQMLAMYARGKAEGGEGDLAITVIWAVSAIDELITRVADSGIAQALRNIRHNLVAAHPAKTVEVTEEMVIAACDAYDKFQNGRCDPMEYPAMHAALTAVLIGEK